LHQTGQDLLKLLRNATEVHSFSVTQCSTVQKKTNKNVHSWTNQY